MKNILLTILIALIMSIGILFTLIQIYASANGLSYPYNGSIMYITSAVFTLVMLLNLNSTMSTINRWINFIMATVFVLSGLIFSLICLYSSPTHHVEVLAGIIFVIGSIVVSSGVLLLGKTLFIDRVKMNIPAIILLTIVALFQIWFGFTYSLILLYNSPDMAVYPLYSGLVYLSIAIFILILFISLVAKIHIFLKWFIILIAMVFSAWGILISCSYFCYSSLNYQGLLASALFLLSAITPGLGIVFINRKQT